MGRKNPETRFKERIRPLLSALPNTWLVKIQQVVLRGTPDFLMCINGVFVALELKSSCKENPTELQLYNLKKITEARGLALVVYPENWSEVYECLHQISKNGKIPDIRNLTVAEA